jgi:putative endonuclease
MIGSKMYIVYGLYSPGYNKIYIGFSSDLDSRLFFHNNSTNKGYTSRFRPWIIIYKEEAPDKTTAMKREKQLKSARGRLFIKTFIPAEYSNKRSTTPHNKKTRI